MMRTCLIFLLVLLSNAVEFLLSFKNIYQLFLETTSLFWLNNQVRLCVACRDIYISTAAAILFFCLFDHIVLETPSVFWLSNQSIVLLFVRSFIICIIHGFRYFITSLFEYN